MNTPNPLTEESKRIHLLSSEKDAIKSRILVDAPDTSTALPPVAAPSPFFSYGLFARATALALVIVVVTGTGITYAAQHSEPGDRLYAFELNVVEPIEEAFQVTGTQKVAYHTERLEERLHELQQTRNRPEAASALPALAAKTTEHATEVEAALVTEGEVEIKIDGLEKASALVEANEEILESVSIEDEALKDAGRSLTRNLEETNDEYATSGDEASVRDSIGRKLIEAGADAGVEPDERTLIILKDRLEDVTEEITENDLPSALDIVSEVRVDLLKKKYLVEASEEQSLAPNEEETSVEL